MPANQQPAHANASASLAGRIGMVRFDEQDVRAIELVLAQFADRHKALVPDGVDALCAAWQAADVDLASEESVQRCILLAHDLGGIGGTLGFPLVTSLCRSLNRYLRLERAILPAAREVIAIHLSALRLVAAHRIMDDGGHLGREITNELSRAIAKFDDQRSRQGPAASSASAPA